MTNYPVIDEYLDLLKEKRDLLKDKSNENQLEILNSKIESGKKSVVYTIENVLIKMGLKKRRILADFKVHMVSDAGLMVEFRTIPSIKFLERFEKDVGGFVPANYCRNPKKSFYMFKY